MTWIQKASHHGRTTSQNSTPNTITPSKLVILYGIGGLSDVGRHCIPVALREFGVKSICVLSPFPELLDESNGECGCREPHSFSEEEKKMLQMVHVKDWSDPRLSQYFEGATAVISTLGNRQPGFFNPQIKEGWIATEGTQVVLKGMQAHNLRRAVVVSSMGVEEDWPPMEWHWAGHIMKLLFWTNTRKAYKDLTTMERAYKAYNEEKSAKEQIDFLFVRPCGISEEAVPSGKWRIQKEKYKDTNLELDMAKLDVARFCVQEAMKPSYHRQGVVIGGVKQDKSDK